MLLLIFLLVGFIMGYNLKECKNTLVASKCPDIKLDCPKCKQVDCIQELQGAKENLKKAKQTLKDWENILEDNII